MQNSQKNDKTQSSVGKHPLLTFTKNFLSFDVLSVFKSSSFTCLQRWMHLWFKGVEIFYQKGSATRELQECWPLTFRLKDQYLASFLRLSSEYEVRSLIIAKISRYFTGKNTPFKSHSDLDLQNIDPFFVWRYSFYDYVPMPIFVQPDKLNNGRTGTFLRKGLCISITDCEGTATDIERKWRQLYMTTFEKLWIQYLGSTNWRQLLKNLLPQEI